MCDIIFDQSARNIFARCQALVDFIYLRILHNKKKITWSLGDIKVHVFHSFAALTHEIFFNTERIFVSPRGHVHVISSLCYFVHLKYFHDSMIYILEIVCTVYLFVGVT